MKHSATNEQAIVNILLRYWEEILVIEQQFQLVVGKGDMRARIDYFHDAIRAYTKQHKTKEDEARLKVEELSYDVQCLRYLTDMPLASITHDAHHLSPGSALVKGGEGLVETPKRINRDIKVELGELYGKYGVLFSALMKKTAEDDYLDRTDGLNHDVEEINKLIHAISNNTSTQEIIQLIHALSDASLKADLLLLIPQMKGKSAGALKGLIDRLRAHIQKNDKRIKGVDKAYHEYATAQLAIYEAGKDMLKQMASSGMNLVGQFVESAMRQGQRGRGR